MFMKTAHILFRSLGLLCLAVGVLCGFALPVRAQTTYVPGIITEVPGYDTWTNPAAFASIGKDESAVGSWRFGTRTGDPLWPKDDMLNYFSSAFIDKTFTYLYIEGVDDDIRIDASTARTMTSYVNLDTQTAGYTWEHSDEIERFTVEFRMKLVRDVLKWEYRITNKCPRPKRIGFRVVADIDFFGNPSGDYYLPLKGRQRDKQELVGSNVPSEWSIRYTPPGMEPVDLDFRPVWKARMPFGGDVTKPARVAFAEEDELTNTYGWAAIINAALPANVNEPPLITWGDTWVNDSFALGLYYPVLYIGTGETRVITGRVEYNWAEVKTLQHNALAVYAPDWVGFREGDDPSTPAVENGYFAPLEIPVRAYVNNSSLITAPNVSVTVDPGPGLRLKQGQSNSYALSLTGLEDALCRRTASDEFSWILEPDGTASGLVPIRVTATFTPGGSINVVNYVNVPALPTRAFTNGHHLLGFPFDFTNKNALTALGLGPGVQLATWDTAAREYRFAAQDGVTLAPGRGYWLRLPTSTTVSLLGAFPVNQREVQRVPLSRGWNLISSPFQYSVEWGQCRIYHGETEYPMNEAVRRGYVRAELWTWDPAVNSYLMPYHLYTPQNALAAEIKPYVGYWLYATEDVLLVYAPNPFVPAMMDNPFTPWPSSRQAGSADRWRVNIVVEAGGVKDLTNTFGVDPEEADGPSRGDVMKPPMSPAGLSAYFVRNAWGSASGGYGVDMQAPGGVKTWTFEVDCRQPGAQVVLRWPDLTQVPAGVPIVLTDELTGQQTVLRGSASYRFNSGNGGTRRFTVTAGGILPPLQFTQVQVTPAGRGAGMTTLTYGLTTPADVQVKVRSVTGRLLCTLTPGRASETGLYQVTWNGRDAQNRLLPRGVYLVELHAQAADQRQVRRTITIRNE